MSVILNTAFGEDDMPTLGEATFGCEISIEQKTDVSLNSSSHGGSVAAIKLILLVGSQHPSIQCKIQGCEDYALAKRRALVLASLWLKELAKHCFIAKVIISGTLENTEAPFAAVTVMTKFADPESNKQCIRQTVITLQADSVAAAKHAAMEEWHSKLTFASTQVARLLGDLDQAALQNVNAIISAPEAGRLYSWYEKALRLFV